MVAENDLHSDHLDRLFEHRNKEYGAYALRKGYNRQLLKASLGMCLVVAHCVGGYFIWRITGAPETKEVATVSVIGCSLELLVPDEPDTAKQQPLFCYMVPVIVPDSMLSKGLANLEDAPIPVFRDEIPGIIRCPLPLEPPPEEFGTDAASKTDSVEPECFTGGCVEIRPQYPGGREAMLRFIDSALGRPGLVAEMDSTMEEMEKVKVLARFRIETDGRIADIHFPFPAIEPYQSNVRRVL